MESQEKSIMRARLIVSGTIRWWEFDKSKEVHAWLQILAEEVVKIADVEIVESIRESLRRNGLHLPAFCPLTLANGSDQGGLQTETGRPSNNDENKADMSTFLYTRRANNQVSEYTEAHIQELLGRGMSKSAVARALRVNRRVVIRVAREAQSAQQRPKCSTNDLGTISEGR